ncbi:hypothetical protein HKD37_07G019319 [Glycine soja]
MQRSYSAQWNALELPHDKHMSHSSCILREMEVEESLLGLSQHMTSRLGEIPSLIGVLGWGLVLDGLELPHDKHMSHSSCILREMEVEESLLGLSQHMTSRLGEIPSLIGVSGWGLVLDGLRVDVVADLGVAFVADWVFLIGRVHNQISFFSDPLRSFRQQTLNLQNLKACNLPPSHSKTPAMCPLSLLSSISPSSGAPLPLQNARVVITGDIEIFWEHSAQGCQKMSALQWYMLDKWPQISLRRGGRENANLVFILVRPRPVPMSSSQATRLRFPLSCKMPFTKSEPHRDNPSLVFKIPYNSRDLRSLNQSL